MKTIILCADDFSLNPAINAGILDLLIKNRLSAVSCMTQSPTWDTDARQLLPWKNQTNIRVDTDPVAISPVNIAPVDIGLHFNLTHPFPKAYNISLPLLMLQSYLRFLSKQKIRDSLCFQLDAFESAMKTMPDFIDGHQHVHIFPMIREIVIEEYLKRYGNTVRKPYIRSFEYLPANTQNFKAKILQSMGTQAQARLLKLNKIPCNTAFAGIYDFNPEENLDQRMKEWLNVLPANSLIMCHPALETNCSDDAIATARFSEYTYLSSERFLQTMNACHVELTHISK